MTEVKLKARLKELYIENRKSLRTSEHLVISKEILKIKDLLEYKI